LSSLREIDRVIQGNKVRAGAAKLPSFSVWYREVRDVWRQHSPTVPFPLQESLRSYFDNGLSPRQVVEEYQRLK